MKLQLSSQNVLEYLAQHQLADLEEREQIKIELKSAKNFNLLIHLPNKYSFLIKQERFTKEGLVLGEFVREWEIFQLLQNFVQLDIIRPYFREILHLNSDNYILIFEYLKNYQDLADFYYKENRFSHTVAATLGVIIATIQRSTFAKNEYRDFLLQNPTKKPIYLVTKLDRITPDIFGVIPDNGIKFLTLYQRYDSLKQAISQLTETYDSCCLVHNDLKLNNILIHLNWEEQLTNPNPSHPSIIRLIDWERGSWGDPAFDLGTLIASYLKLWLDSLVVSKNIAIEESLRMAMTPLELLQPSLSALMEAYLREFSEILDRHPDFLCRVVQFTGLALIGQIQAMIQYQKTFGNAGICTLQVAKTLLCHPESSIITIFGKSASELTEPSFTTT
jgi:hypothetical protein